MTTPFQSQNPQPAFLPLPTRPKRKGMGCLVAVLIVVALVVIVAIASALNGGGGKASTMQPANQVPAAASTSTAPADAADPTGLSNNGWTITTFNMKPDGVGSFGAVARIVNSTGADKKVATFTVTVLDAKKNIVATLIGLTNSVAKDATVTVDLVSTDPYKAGTYLYAFQVNASM
jgi:hypothetical protein